MTAPFSPVHLAERIADELLFPAAAATDAADVLPRRHLDELAAAGLYGLADEATRLPVVEALAGGCLTTTFVWIQHHSALRAVAASPLRDGWLDAMSLGKSRAGIAVAGIRPAAGGVSARAVDGGWRINGTVPWVTGWGLIDVVHTAAIGPDGEVLWALLDAVESPSLRCRRLRLVAVNASLTVSVTFDDHFLPAERVTGIESHSAWAVRDARDLRANGSLALGLVRRCCRLLGPGPLDEQLVACRAALDGAAACDTATLPAARAAASALAQRPRARSWWRAAAGPSSRASTPSG